MRYLLGVDGGNTKTDYFLFTDDGDLVDSFRSGTCSHEALEDSYEGSYRVMKKDINYLLNKNNLEIKDISAACFGLAGVDIPIQKVNLEEIIKKLGFINFVVINDSFLGIKAGTSNGYGVCSINGTGASNSGIDSYGNYLQVGGIGEISGDLAGGHFVAREVVKAVYNEAYRMGESTSLTPIVFKMLGVDDKYYLLESISLGFFSRTINYDKLTIACFEEANNGDKVARRILTTMGDEQAKSGAGIITNLNFEDPVEVVLAGSVWVKGACSAGVEEYTKKVAHYSRHKCKVSVLSVPPATGAVIWAKELLDSKFPDLEMRKKIIDSVSKELNRIEG